MKKLVSFVLAAAAAASMSVSAFAAVQYDVENKSVWYDAAQGKKTVIITKGDGTSDSDIVYINENSDGFGFVPFLLKLNANGTLDDGVYTIRMNGSDPQTFYVGMTNNNLDVELTRAAGEITNEDGTKNYGYVNNDATGTFRNIVVKNSGDYFAIGTETVMTLEGTAVAIQLNGVSTDDNIEGVWLTNRAVDVAE